MILLISGFIIYILRSLDLLYLFQIKEYRLDRILSFFKETNLLKTLYFPKIKMPAITLRNLLISWGIFFNIFPLYFFLKNTGEFHQIIFLLISPVVAFLSMVIGLLLSEIPVLIYRRLIIYQASRMVNNARTTFIGITGSYGKTSTKEFLFGLLSKKFKTAKSEKNYNTDIGVALSIIRNLKSDTEIFITEVGAYRKGEIKNICKIIKPKYGILTGIGNQHLSLFGSYKNLISAKAELLEALPVEGKAYINGEIEDWKYFSEKTPAKKCFYSVMRKSDIYSENLKQSGGVTEADIIYNDVKLKIKTKLLGNHTLQNLLPCIALASDLKVEKNTIESVIANLNQVHGRLSLEKGIRRSVILNDSYSANVEGFIAAIKTAGNMNYKRKFIVNRGLIELGHEKSRSYQRILTELKKTAVTLLTTDELFKKLNNDSQVKSFRNENLIVDYIKANADKNTLIVIEGRLEPKTINALCHSRFNRESI